ncbi:MAG: YbaN family protein [Candidatus Sumerlaeaceae bacterium]
MRVVLFVLGILLTGLGIIGVFLPIMPTTIFLILALPCFARSSPKFEAWLLNHRWFGPSLRAWKSNGAISTRAKVLAMITLWVSITGSCFFVPWYLRIMLISIAASVSAYVITRPTAQL